MLLLLISFLVLVSVFGSLIPHIRHAWLDKGTNGISLLYIFFNVICSTEHLLLVLFYTINLPVETGYWTHHPRNALDWVNFIQACGVWALWNVLLGLNLYYRDTSRLRKTLTLVIYFCFLMVSLVPMVADAISDIFCPPHHPNCPEMDRDAVAFFQGFHSVILLPFLTTLPLLIGIVKQAFMPCQTQSLTGTKLQAVIFMLSAISWVPRVDAPWDVYLEGRYPIIAVFNAWYHMVGFVAVDDAVFALGQGILLWLSLRQVRRAEDAERQPLLGSSE